MAGTDGPVVRILGGLRERGSKVHSEPSGKWRATCPAHDDRRASLSISEGDDSRALLYCHAGCAPEEVVAALGLTMADLYPRRESSGRRIIATYDYTNESGALLFQALRYEPKGFRQRRPDSNGGWIWNLDDNDTGHKTRRVLFHVPELLAADPAQPVYVVEGEKDALNLAGLGLTATTNPGGAGKWRREFNQALTGRRVVIIPDNDEPGREHALKVARSLQGVAASVQLVELPNPPPKGDVTDWLNAGGTREGLERLVAETPEWKPEPGSERERRDSRRAGARPTIVVRKEIAAVTDEAQAALLSFGGGGVHQRARMLVRVLRDDVRKIPGLIRPLGVPVIESISVAHLRELLDRAARWLRKVGDGRGSVALVPVLVPEWVPETLLARGAWPFPLLEGVVEQPILRPDGTVLDEPGYDAQTAILFEPSAMFPPVPATPNQAEAQAAAHEVLAPFAEFPFIAESDRSAVLAAILTLVGRAAIDGCIPLIVVRATAPGTGKGLLVIVVCLIGSGREPTLFSVTHDDDETRKRLLTIGLTGAPAILLDNVEGTLGSPSLAAALTARELTDRLLGSNRLATVPMRATWFATGNGLAFRGDLGRRVIPIDLDARTEHPEDRRFQIEDLLGYVRAERPRLVVAALTILRAFCLAGRPRDSRPLFGSFEAWDRLIRAAVIWVGLEDPCAGRDRLRAEGDVDLDTLRTLLVAWAETFGEESVTVARAIDKAFSGTGTPTLREALVAVDPRSDGRAVNPRTIGDRLRRWRGRIAGGLALESDGKGHGGATRWRVAQW
jgi:putative DNA primase/helicase